MNNEFFQSIQAPEGRLLGGAKVELNIVLSA